MVDDLERSRAEFALEQVELWLKGGPKAKRSADNLPGLPVMLRTQGLLISLLTLRAKGGTDVAVAIETWLTRRAPQPPLKNDRADVEFLTLCTNATRSAYLAAQWEAIVFAQMLKLVAAALNLSESG